MNTIGPCRGFCSASDEAHHCSSSAATEIAASAYTWVRAFLAWDNRDGSKPSQSLSTARTSLPTWFRRQRCWLSDG